MNSLFWHKAHTAAEISDPTFPLLVPTRTFSHELASMSVQLHGELKHFICNIFFWLGLDSFQQLPHLMARLATLTESAYRIRNVTHVHTTATNAFVRLLIQGQ